MIEMAQLTRRYGRFTAVDRLDLSIGPGEIVGLLGPNGAGKSTVMKMLAGFLEPSEGLIRVEGMDIGHDRLAVQARIGYLPENCPTWPEMTVADFLEFQAAMHGVAAAERRRAVARAIRRTALEAKAGAVIQTLSRGYRQRVGVAQAILHQPAIVILDEPTNGLDPSQIQQMRGLVAELAASATVIVSTHILQEVEASCERVVILRQGRKVVDARLAELQRGRRLLVGVAGDAERSRSALAGAPGVHAVHDEGEADGCRRWALEAEPDAAPAVSAAVLGAGLALHAIGFETRNLETLFAQVNRADEPARSEEVADAV